jgi:hypothetical protein
MSADDSVPGIASDITEHVRAQMRIFATPGPLPPGVKKARAVSVLKSLSYMPGMGSDDGLNWRQFGCRKGFASYPTFFEVCQSRLVLFLGSARDSVQRLMRETGAVAISQVELSPGEVAERTQSLAASRISTKRCRLYRPGDVGGTVVLPIKDDYATNMPVQLSEEDLGPTEEELAAENGRRTEGAHAELE